MYEILQYIEKKEKSEIKCVFLSSRLTCPLCHLSPAVDLASVLTPEVMAPILANPEVQQRLMPYLPSGESLPQSSEELHNTLSSPQFQQVKSCCCCCSQSLCICGSCGN